MANCGYCGWGSGGATWCDAGQRWACSSVVGCAERIRARRDAARPRWWARLATRAVEHIENSADSIVEWTPAVVALPVFVWLCWLAS